MITVEPVVDEADIEQLADVHASGKHASSTTHVGALTFRQ